MKTVIRPETEMKDSGIEWIGDIPKDWNSAPIKVNFDIYAGATPSSNNPIYWDGDIAWITPADYKTEDKYVSCGKRHISQDGYDNCSAILVPANSIIFSKRAPIGTVAISKNELCTNQGCLSCVSKDDSNIEFYYYAMSIATEEFELKGSGTTFKEISLANFKNFRFAVPPLSEQQAIADYLDETCFKIDEIIAEAKASIDEYKELKQSVIDKAVLHGLCNGMMKDSGNDLIGKIPLSWEMRKLKYVADFNPGITTAYDAQKEVGYVPMNCVKNGYMNPLSARLSDMSTGLTGFQDGDIVIAKVTPCFENGNIAVAENLEQGVAFGSSELFVIRTHSINRRFMLYYLQNSVFKNQCISTMTGTGGLKRVSGYFVNNAYITYPPENEQQVIVNYLDEAVKNMDSLIAEKQSLIADLEAYKKSLIYEVVTGKRRVV